ncbi:MAG: FGGY family carbohydrate kinase, partial [Pannonibacter indicus]
MHIGLDIGTSSVKAILMDDSQAVIASASAHLTVERPHPGWSEQDPDSWWTALEQAMDAPAWLRIGQDTSTSGSAAPGDTDL